MKKSYLSLSLSAIVITGVIAISSIGCAKKPKVVDYQPLFPESTMISGYRNFQAECTNAVVRDFNTIFKEKIEQLWSICETEPEGLKAKKSFDEAYAMYSEEFPKLIGLTAGDYRWLAFSMGDISVPLGEPENITMPDMTVVLYTAKPVDPIALVEGGRKLFLDEIKKDFKDLDVDNATFDEFLAEAEKVASFEKTEWNGRPAVRLIIKDEDIKESLLNFSPILTQIGDGRLLVLASNRSSLEEIEGVYAGTVKPLAKDSAIVSTLEKSKGSLAFFAFPKIDKWIAKTIPAEGLTADSLEEPMDLVVGLKALFVEIGTQGDSIYTDYKVVFNNEMLAKKLEAYFNMGKSFISLAIPSEIPDPSLQPLALDFIDKISATTSGGEFKIRLPVSSSLLKKINVFSFVKMLGESADDEE